MIELKRLKLINWHNFENVTFDCARLTYMIGVNAVGKTHHSGCHPLLPDHQPQLQCPGQ